MKKLNAPDLTQRAPRSPRVRLGGYALLPRVLDKCRAKLAGTNGEYNYNCPLDRRFFDFAGVNARALKAQATRGKGDGELLVWILAHRKHKHSDAEIANWSRASDERTPGDVESRQYFNNLHQKAAPQREDIHTWFDLLDVDDYVSFGGKA